MSKRKYHVVLQDRGLLALPPELRERHHLNDPGAQVLIVERDDGVIELHPLASVPASQCWFWSERWQRMEREADEDVAAGRVRTYEDLDDLLDTLDR